MKHLPTLADACIATALNKRMGGLQPELRHLLLGIADARKFVLDQQMSAYLADLSVSFWRGGHRKRNIMLENARQMARLPHPVTWIELDFANGHFPRLKQLGHAMIAGINGEPLRYGWLVRQHPKIDTAFIATEIRTSSLWPDHVFTHPVSVQWCSDDTPLMWKKFHLFEDETSEFMVRMEGYLSTQVYWSPTFSFDLSWRMVEEMREGHYHGSTPNPELFGAFAVPRFPVRDLWSLLATINDLPVKIEAVQPSRGYVSRGNYKKFLQHSVVHLNVPESQWRKLVAKSAVMLRKRAHQVRGHWRKDWRHPLSVLCEHVFDAEMICRNCRGRQVWVHEHQRGDASIGFVTHDYEVHQKEAS
jgi:hypothetical protein